MENQLDRIKKKLKQVKKIDPDYEEFGSVSHQYKLNPPATEIEVKTFENKIGARLPTGYRAFLLAVGNGGCGPYYGLYKIEQETLGLVGEPSRVVSALTTYERKKALEFAIKGEFSEHIITFNQLLLIGDQGCTFYHALVMNGEHEGRVVYVEEVTNTGFLTFEVSFLDWYERWLDERLKGYNTPNFCFGIGGDEFELLNLFVNSDSESEKICYLEGMYKLPEITASSIGLLIEISENENSKVRLFSMRLLVKFDYESARIFLHEIFKANNEDDILFMLQSLCWYQKTHCSDWCQFVVKLLPSFKNIDAVGFAFKLFENAKFKYNEFAIELLQSSDNKIRDYTIYQIGTFAELGLLNNKTDHYRLLLACLDDSDQEIVGTSLQTISKFILSELSLYLELLPYLEKIIDRFDSDKVSLTKLINRLLDGIASGKITALPLSESRKIYQKIDKIQSKMMKWKK